MVENLPQMENIHEFQELLRYGPAQLLRKKKNKGSQRSLHKYFTMLTELLGFQNSQLPAYEIVQEQLMDAEVLHYIIN